MVINDQVGARNQTQAFCRNKCSEVLSYLSSPSVVSCGQSVNLLHTLRMWVEWVTQISHGR